jgi:HSP20 family molecular chaperone IbpA
MSTTKNAATETPKLSASCATALPRAIPAADIYETEESLQLILDVPGARVEDLEITEHQGRLAVQTTPGAPAERSDRGAIREWSVRQHVRSFQLPHNVDAARIEAHLENGVLQLTIPKIPESTRRIEVHSS